MSDPNIFSKIRIVLVGTSHPGNIGAAARAMKNMGLSALYLVRPKDFPAPRATWRAANASDLLDNAKVVDSIDDAFEHITKFGSRHTDAIISNDKNSIDKFKRLVNSSSVMINTSTRFADGFEYGLGAEIGISTDKLHARGPVGLDGLTILKYIVSSKGKIRN